MKSCFVLKRFFVEIDFGICLASSWVKIMFWFSVDFEYFFKRFFVMLSLCKEMSLPMIIPFGLFMAVGALTVFVMCMAEFILSLMYNSLAPGAQQTSRILSCAVISKASTHRIDPNSRPYMNPFEISSLLFDMKLNLIF